MFRAGSLPGLGRRVSKYPPPTLPCNPGCPGCPISVATPPVGLTLERYATYQSARCDRASVNGTGLSGPYSILEPFAARSSGDSLGAPLDAHIDGRDRRALRA